MLQTQGAVPRLEPRQTFTDRYRIVKVLKRGGLATTLEAQDLGLRRSPVVLKVFHPSVLVDDDAVQKLQRAVLLARQLSYVHIVRMFDVDRTPEGISYLSMEYVEGQSLQALLAKADRGKIPVEIAIRILSQIAAGLAYAHQKGVLHLDLKPDNVLISAAGEVKIADFGISRSLEQDLGMTRTGDPVGTAPYMAPEQFTGAAQSTATDVYSFGVIAYQMLTGVLPYKSTNFFALAEKHLQAEFPSVLALRPEVPKWCAQLVAECVEKQPEQRIPEGAALRERFSAAGHTLGGERAYTRYLAKRIRSRRRFLMGHDPLVITLAAIVMLFFGIREEKTRVALASRLVRAEYSVSLDLGLLKTLVGVNGSLEDSQSLLTAVKHRDSRSIQALLEANIDVTAKDERGHNAFHYAVEYFDEKILWALRRAGAAINFQNEQGDTPLLYALKEKNYHAAQILLSMGADPNLPDADGVVPLANQVQIYNRMMVFLLLEFRASPNVRMQDGLPLLLYAVRSGNQELTALLLKYGAEINVRDGVGRSALHLAVFRPELVKTLLTAQPDIEARDAQGKTPLMYAAEGGFTRSVELLLAAGAASELSDLAGRTAFDYAVKRRDEALISLLRETRL